MVLSFFIVVFQNHLPLSICILNGPEKRDSHIAENVILYSQCLWLRVCVGGLVSNSMQVSRCLMAPLSTERQTQMESGEKVTENVGDKSFVTQMAELKMLI
jgi:hypothetical protein